MAVLEFYENILRSLGLELDDQKFVYVRSSDGTQPLTIQGKKLVLPTQEILKEANWEEYIGFHPLAESAVRSESIVMKRLRSFVMRKLTTTIVDLLSQVMEAAADPDQHSKVGPNGSDLFAALDNVNQTSVKNLTKVLRRISPDGDNRVINIYPKRGGMWEGKNYRRVAVVTFPILDNADEKEPMFFDVKVRPKDKKHILALFNWLLPDADKKETYSIPTNTMTSATFYSIMMAFAKVMEILNEKIEIFRDVLDNADELSADISWVEEMPNLPKYRAAIVALDGNQGELIDSGDEQSADGKGVEIKDTGTTKRERFDYSENLLKDEVSEKPAPTRTREREPVPAPRQEKPAGFSWQDVQNNSRRTANRYRDDDDDVPWHEDPPSYRTRDRERGRGMSPSRDRVRGRDPYGYNNQRGGFGGGKQYF